MTHDIDITSSGKTGSFQFFQGALSDDFERTFRSIIEHDMSVLFDAQTVHSAIAVVAKQHQYNPVQEYLENIVKYWDGKDRFKTFFPDFLGVEKSKVTTLITRTWLFGAVAKVFDPEFKFDYVLDLVGAQGSGKTTLLKKLAHGYYTDQFSDFTNKNNSSYQEMLRAWIVNDDEMTATNNSTFEELKKFISAETLAYRPPYAMNGIRVAKNFVLARTTNEGTYLKDKTGERRFLPLLARKEYQKYHPVTYLNDEYIGQLWAQATNEFLKNYNDQTDESYLYLSPEDEKLLASHRKNFEYIDEVENQVDEFLNDFDEDFVTSANIANGLGERNLVNNRSLARKIKYLMDNREDWRASAKNGKRGYKRV
ncbi:VapE domain-containing protein [Oenococcus alcoholitolerans]|uniref:VapE domain-containing protein n=1 Tax=Oenococcus alcoholitolerans TaxID=931074 RepID=UPI003F6FD9D8